MVRAEYIVPVLLCVCYGASGLPRIDPLVETKVGLIRGLTADNGDYSMFLGIPYATVDPLNPFGFRSVCKMGRAGIAVLLLLCINYTTSSLPRVDPLVDTKLGLIKGLTADNGEYSMFLGIPYATVDPLNPFGPSVPHPGFESTFNAIDDSAVCPQREEFNNTLVGTLDCLHLNVYVPNTASSRNPRPVMVWIHGGGFSYGFGGRFIQGPKFIVRHDVILVTLNYRLGAYGFLCVGIPEVPGNQGLKDQLAALRWVKNNIESFGGNSNQITVFGESAGGASVDFHLIYTEENLFNNVIIQSGTSLSPFALDVTDPSGPIRLAEHLGFKTNDINSALEFLRKIDTELIVTATSEAGITTIPCVEKKYDNVEPFITSYPASKNVQKARSVPILIGFNSNEEVIFYENLDSEDYKDLNPFLDLASIFDFDSELLSFTEDIFRQFYIGDEDINEDIKEQLVKFTSDFYFYHPSYRSIQKYFENGASKVYHYVFSYDGDRNFLKRRKNATEVSGAAHADELSYLFDMVLFAETPTPEDQLTIDRITTLWTNFAKYSNPTPETSDILPVQWPAVTKDTLHYLDIDSELTIKKRPFHERMAFWDLFFKLNQQFLKRAQEN